MLGLIRRREHAMAGQAPAYFSSPLITPVSGEKLHESRRDSATKPRVARNELPWVHRGTTGQRQRGCVRRQQRWPPPDSFALGRVPGDYYVITSIRCRATRSAQV